MYDERKDYGDILVRLTETHSVYIPSWNCYDDDWDRWAIMSRLCVGQGWKEYTVGLGLGGWVYAVGPSSIKRYDWHCMPYITVLLHGDIIGVAVQSDRILSRYRSIMKRKDYQDLVTDSDLFVTAGIVCPRDWCVPVWVCAKPFTSDKYTIQIVGARTVYSVWHARHPNNRKPYTFVKPIANVDLLADMYWKSRYELGTKFVKLYRYNV